MVTYNQLQTLQQQTNSNNNEADLFNFLNSPSPSAATTSTNNNVDDIRSTRKERKHRPTRSTRSSATSSTASSRNKSFAPLDDPNFAPPPLLPPDDEVLKPTYAMNAMYEADYTNMPSYDKIRHAGHIMTRFSAVSLLTKKWRQNYWILYGTCLYFFRSKDDFEEWLFNPYLTRDKRADLVKRYLNFKDEDSKFFRVDKIGMKYYRKGGMMYHFKLDKHYATKHQQSLHLVAAFSSLNENDVIELHTILTLMLKKSNPNMHVPNQFQSSRRGGGAFSETHSAYSGNYSYTSGYNSAASAGF